MAEFVAEFIELHPFGEGALMDVLLKAVRERTQLAVQRNDFKLDMLQPHLFMNFRIVDEHGRQLGMGRHLASLKAELGGQARSAFQALAALKLGSAAAPPAPAMPSPAAGSASTKTARVPAPQAVLAPAAPLSAATYTAWTFGELP